MKMDNRIKAAAIAAGAVGAAIGALMFAAAPKMASDEEKRKFAGRYYAHRGLHTEDMTVPENSLSAFRQAVEAGYGMELDVQLSKDGRVVVFHDDDLKRACGVDMRVDELDFRELRELRLFGTEERIPLFSEVLKLVNGREPIICELKTGKRNRELCEKTYELMDFYGGDICIESFDPTIVAWFRKYAPDVVRGQLAQPRKLYSGSGISRAAGFLCANTLLNFYARPHFIAYRIGRKAPGAALAKALGAMDFGWTSRSFGDEKGRDGVIFEFYAPEKRMK